MKRIFFKHYSIYTISHSTIAIFIKSGHVMKQHNNNTSYHKTSRNLFLKSHHNNILINFIISSTWRRFTLLIVL